METGTVEDWAAAPVPAVGALALAVGRGEGSDRLPPSASSPRPGRNGAACAAATSTRGWCSASGSPAGWRAAPWSAPDGRLIGLAVSGPRRKALAIPASTVERAVKALGAQGYVARGFLGVSLHPLAGKGSDGGAIVVGIEPDRPAGKAGLVVGDIITTWDGEAIKTVGAVSERLGTDVVGQTVKLGVVRGGNAIELDVTIGERPRA